MVAFITNSINPSILIVEKQDTLLAMLSYNLKRYGFLVSTATTSQKALELAQNRHPNLILISDAVTDIAPFDLCKELRAINEIKSSPMIMLLHEAGELSEEQAQTSNMNRPTPEEGGADDYIQLPMAPNDLIANIRRIFRRSRTTFTTKLLHYDDIEMNLASYKVTKSGQDVHLGPTEFRILQCLLEYPKRVLSRDYIMSYVWGKKNSIEPRTIDVHINRLRTALKTASNDDRPSIIQTIRSAGYCLSKEVG